MKKFSFLPLLAVLLSGIISFQNTSAQTSQVKNIILLIGDGMGINQVQAAMLASDKPLQLQRSQFFGFSNTSSANSKITDSGAGGTAIAIGHKTYNGAIGVDVDTIPQKSVLELAEERNLATGLVSTCDITHATPASFIAHQPKRDMAAEIALDFLQTPVDVVIGGGRKNFNDRKDDRNLLSELQSAGYIITDHISGLKVQKGKQFFCLVDEGHLPPMSKGRGDYLPQSVDFALQQLATNPNGFFIMIEGSQIDWGGHANDIDYIVDEVIDFDKAVGVAFDFADKNPGTLVIVTADHETGGLVYSAKEYPSDELEAGFVTKGHSASLVPVFAYGSGAERFSGIYENSAIFDKMLESFGWETK